MKNKHRGHRILWTEAAGFTVIIALSWVSELTRLPHLLFNEPFSVNWNRALLRTVVVLAAWVLVHVETKRLLKRLYHLEEFLLVCSWCRRIGDRGEWVSMEKYFGSNFATQTSHGMCPECSAKLLQGAAPKAATRAGSSGESTGVERS